MKAVGGPGSDGHEEENHDQSSDPEEILVLDPEELIPEICANPHSLHEAADPEQVDLLLHFFLQLLDVLEIGELVFESGHVDCFGLLFKVVLFHFYPLQHLQKVCKLLVLITISLTWHTTGVLLISIVKIAEGDVGADLVEEGGARVQAVDEKRVLSVDPKRCQDYGDDKAGCFG